MYFAIYWLFHDHIIDEIFFFSGGRKTAGASSAKSAPTTPKQSPAVAGRASKLSDEITIIPQGKNTQAKPKVPVLVSLIWWILWLIFRKMKIKANKISTGSISLTLFYRPKKNRVKGGVF